MLANAFSFTAVPSAIHHAGGEPVYVEATDAYVMCVDDLKAKIEAEKQTGNPAKYLMLTHMRGKVNSAYPCDCQAPANNFEYPFALPTYARRRRGV